MDDPRPRTIKNAVLRGIEGVVYRRVVRIKKSKAQIYRPHEFRFYRSGGSGAFKIYRVPEISEEFPLILTTLGSLFPNRVK